MTPQTGVPASGEIIIPACGACSLTPPPPLQGMYFFHLCIPRVSTAFKNNLGSESGAIPAKRRHVLHVFTLVSNSLSTVGKTEMSSS